MFRKKPIVFSKNKELYTMLEVPGRDFDAEERDYHRNYFPEFLSEIGGELISAKHSNVDLYKIVLLGQTLRGCTQYAVDMTVYSFYPVSKDISEDTLQKCKDLLERF